MFFLACTRQPQLGMVCFWHVWPQTKSQMTQERPVPSRACGFCPPDRIAPPPQKERPFGKNRRFHQTYKKKAFPSTCKKKAFNQTAKINQPPDLRFCQSASTPGFDRPNSARRAWRCSGTSASRGGWPGPPKNGVLGVPGFPLEKAGQKKAMGGSSFFAGTIFWLALKGINGQPQFSGGPTF